MKSMKVRTRPAVTLASYPANMPESGPEYPWGLKITLEKDQIMILGMAEVSVDDEVTITAKAKVCGVHKSERQTPSDDSYQHSVDLQITHMDIEKKK